MKLSRCLVIGVLVALLSGCDDDVASAGAGALNNDEEVRVCATTLRGISSRTDSLVGFSITQTPDSFLVGECNSESWATIKAELLTQFACPTGFQFPPLTPEDKTPTIDSIALVMTYSSWFGDGNSPLRLTVYELDKSTFIYDHVYTSQEQLSDYWSGADSTRAARADRIIVAAQPTDSILSSDNETYVPYIRFMMNDRFVRKMNQLRQFPSQEKFNEFFKGLYITSTWGAATALYMGNITMIVYYHYYYEDTPGSGEYTKMNDIKYLYANNEVRQVNRYSFPYKDEIVPILKQHEDSLNFVVSPGYVYTVLSLPMKEYVDAIRDSIRSTRTTMRPYINKAMMRVEITNVSTTSSNHSQWASPAEDMLLINRDSIQTFFSRSKLPSSDYCLLSTLSSTTDSLSNSHYYYNFDLSTLLQNELRSSTQHEQMEMVMIPVNVEYTTTSSSTTVSKVKIDQTITYTVLHSAQHPDDPLDIDVVFSGFSINSIR